MLNQQQKLMISKYQELYDILIPSDHILRQIKELVDFSFIIEEVKKNYSPSMGRSAEDPIEMFKYLMLKDMYELSDRELFKQTLTDMAFKFFLDIAPEETNLIQATTLTKFRNLRLKDEDLLDRLIQKTVQIAIEKGIQIGNTLIVDATHTRARYHQKSMEEVLLDRAKKLRKEVYRIDESMKNHFPKKLENPALDEVIEYCEHVVQMVKNHQGLCLRESISKRLNYLKKGLEDTATALAEVGDAEARVGHKSADDPFFGYKTHISMATNRLITATTITTGEKPDGPELQELIKKTEENGMDVEEVIGDTAYSGKDNLKYAQDNDIGKAVIKMGLRPRLILFRLNQSSTSSRKFSRKLTTSKSNLDSGT